MNKVLVKQGMFVAASLGSIATPVFGENVELQNVADNIVSDYPSLHKYVDELDSLKIDQLCANDFAEIQDSDELQMLLNLSANIQNNSQDICVIRELQSMIGFSEARGVVTQ